MSNTPITDKEKVFGMVTDVEGRTHTGTAWVPAPCMEELEEKLAILRYQRDILARGVLDLIREKDVSEAVREACSAVMQ